MSNPAGNYPGREIFLGSLATGEPAFAYFGSGRSSGSQQRYATNYIPRERAVRIAPTNPAEPFDPFRHYQAVRIQPETGLVVVSNSQAPVDAVYEAYWLGPKVGRRPGEFLRRLLEVLGPEYDSDKKPTSRIVGLFYPLYQNRWIGTVGITDEVNEAETFTFTTSESSGLVPYNTEPGQFVVLPTYDGNIDYRNFSRLKLETITPKTLTKLRSTTAQSLANEIYEMSDYVDPKYGELRVWCVAGVQNGNGPGGWEIRRRNRFKRNRHPDPKTEQ